MPAIRPENRAQLIRVNFSNRGLSKAISTPRDVAPAVPGNASIVDASKQLSQIKVTKQPPIKVSSIKEFLGLDYIGYIIEKERLNKATGQWERIDEYKIIGSQASSFVDTRLAYGNFYRYRIKSIVKLTKAEAKVGFSHLDMLQDIQQYEAKRLSESLDINKELIQDIEKITNLGIQTKGSKGLRPTTIRLSEDVSFVATEQGTSVSQRNISSNENLRLMKNLKVKDKAVLDGTATTSEFQKFINKNLSQFQQKTTEYYSSYYESHPSKNWVYVDVTENVPPPPPQAVKITPNSTKKEIVLSWLKPSNEQRDIKYFKIYKRSNLGETWKLLTEVREVDIDGDGVPDTADSADLFSTNTNVYVDTNVVDNQGAIIEGKQFIYALSSVDVHGIESYLSTQIGVELNKNFQLERKEKPLKFISGQGARTDQLDYILKKFYNRIENIVAKKNIYIAPSTKMSDTKKDLIIKIRSLDTHEVKEIKIVLKNLNIKK